MNIRISILLFLAAVVAGCANTGPYTPAGDRAGPDDPILIHTKDVNHVLAVRGVEVTPRADGRLEVKIVFANRTSKPIRIQVLTRFLDRSRKPVGDETPFENIALGPKASMVHGVVSTDSAEEFEMEVRRN